MARLLAALFLSLGLLLPHSARSDTFSPPAVPQGAWTTYTPTISANSGTITTLGTVVGRWQQTGKRVDLAISIPITTNGTAAGNIVATLPVAAASAATFAGREINTTGKGLTGSITATGITITIQAYDNTYPGGSGYVILVSGSYEAQ